MGETVSCETGAREAKFEPLSSLSHRRAQMGQKKEMVALSGEK